MIHAQGTGGTLRSPLGSEPPLIERLGQLAQRVVARGVRLERPRDVGSTFSIDFDPAQLVAAREILHVLVAEGGEAGVAPSLDLLGRALDDLGRQVLAVE